jgi:hypothetical protein
MESKPFSRREFLERSVSIGLNSALGRHWQPNFASTDMQERPSMNPRNPAWIIIPEDAGFQERLAGAELARGLRSLQFAYEPKIVTAGVTETTGTVFRLEIDTHAVGNPEAYQIARLTDEAVAVNIRMSGATGQALLYSVFEFLERQGVFYGLDGEIFPLEPPAAANFPKAGQPWFSQPRFKVRGLNPWPNFLNSIAVYNREDFRAYLEAMLRMRFNTIGMHVFTETRPPLFPGPGHYCDSYLTFEYGNVGQSAATDTTTTNRWRYLSQRTSTYGMGASNFYDSEVFGSNATTQARNCWEASELAQELWRETFSYAQRLGIRVGVGFEPYKIPDEIFDATPPQARVAQNPKIPSPRLDPDSVAARDILEARLGSLLDAYPSVDYVWLWESEEMNWASQTEGVPFSTTPFKQAHDFLRRHAPQTRLVLSGWGGVVRNFAYFHRELPGDVIFSALGDNLGWDAVSPEFGRLGDRERWFIPWLEDDPSMWFPQFHVHRNREQIDRAEQCGCAGVLGLHWRTRIIDVNAGFQSRYSWHKGLQPEEVFQSYAAASVRAPRSSQFAILLNQCDQERSILCTANGEVENGHHEFAQYSPDYDEGFVFWNGSEFPADVLASQKRLSQALQVLAEDASSPEERERINYIAKQLAFLSPYAESFLLAAQLRGLLNQATALRTQGKHEDARKLIVDSGIPVWSELAPAVRQALLDFQQIVSTRNDLGTLASLHNKYERLALFRLRSSMKEFLGQLPAETDELLEKIRQPEPNAKPRVLLPTRPTILHSGEHIPLVAIVLGPAKPAHVFLCFRHSPTSGEWRRIEMELANRRTFRTALAAQATGSGYLDYYVEAIFSAQSGDSTVFAPREAPNRFYTITYLH